MIERKTTQFWTLVVNQTGEQLNQHPFSDWAVDEADYFRQLNECFTSWKVQSQEGNRYTILLTGMIRSFLP